MEDNDKYFYLPEDCRFDVGNKHELVEDVDPQTLIKLVKFLNPSVTKGIGTHIRYQGGGSGRPPFIS